MKKNVNEGSDWLDSLHTNSQDFLRYWMIGCLEKIFFSRNVLKFMFNSNEFKAAKDASSISYICMLTRLLISTYLTHSTISKMQRTMMEDTFLHLTWSNTFSTLYITLWLNFRNCPLWVWCKNLEYLFILLKCYDHKLHTIGQYYQIS